MFSGDEDNLFDMCGDPAETLAGTVHLIIGNATRQYSSCQCLLKGENNSMVSVTLKDLRLCSVDKSQRKCSSSILKKDENTFVCNETSSAFGSVFNKELPRKVHNESITVSLEVKEPIFDMVWLIVETQGMHSLLFVCLCWEFYGRVNNEVMSIRSVNSGTVPGQA